MTLNQMGDFDTKNGAIPEKLKKVQSKDFES
jgi:hypothetical protein